MKKMNNDKMFQKNLINFLQSSLVSFHVLPSVCCCASVMPSRKQDLRFITLVYCADLLHNDVNFWRADLKISLESEEKNKKLHFHLTDGQKKMIRSGTLIVSKFELPVKNGIAEFSWEDFLRSVNTQTIKFMNENGRIIKGSLQLNA